VRARAHDKVPERIEVLDTMPRTHLGKPNMPAMRLLFAELMQKGGS
jgi:hypothetical protein